MQFPRNDQTTNSQAKHVFPMFEIKDNLRFINTKTQVVKFKECKVRMI